jgi:hypothetical protein
MEKFFLFFVWLLYMNTVHVFHKINYGNVQLVTFYVCKSS